MANNIPPEFFTSKFRLDGIFWGVIIKKHRFYCPINPDQHKFQSLKFERCTISKTRIFYYVILRLITYTKNKLFPYKLIELGESKIV